MEFKRNQDLTKVFDKRWNANNSVHKEVQDMKNRDNIRKNKILSSNSNDYLTKNDFKANPDKERVKSSREIQLERLNQNMSSLRNNRGNFNG